MHLFYTPLLELGMPSFLLDELESKHAIRVLRLSKGDEVQLINGRGGLFVAEIQDDNPKRVILNIRNEVKDFGKRSYALHIAIAPTKNMDRLEWFVEKATEVGIDEITPIICDRSERKEVKIDRLEKIAISAMKQSLKAYLPIIHPPVKLSAFLKAFPSVEQVSEKRFIAHCDAGEKVFLNEAAQPKDSALILIGPEGDFSPTEVELAAAKGCMPLSLGESRLRTETAGIIAAMEMFLLNRS